MPLQEFWYDDPDLLWAYRNSYMQKMEQEIEIANYKAWLTGLYNYIAIGRAFTKNGKYLERPIDFSPKPKSKRTEKQEIAQRIKEKISRGKKILDRQRSQMKG